MEAAAAAVAQEAPAKPVLPTKTPDEWRKALDIGKPEHAAVITLKAWKHSHDQVTASAYKAALNAYRKGPA